MAKEILFDQDTRGKILEGVDFNGWCSIVYEGQDVEAEATAVPKAVSYLRSLLNS